MAGGRLSVLRRLPRLNDIPPPLLLIAIYAGFICLGTGALLLPAATTDGIAAIDALFTAVSAVTVTGLIVADTGGDFTLLGQAVIAVLIQLGGLGLMVFAILVLTALGIPVGMTQRVILREELNQTSLGDLARLSRLILIVALGCEVIASAVLAVVFVPEFGWGHGLWSAVFHAVSAFNNAGFSLYPDSLSGWVGHPVVNLVIPALFILSGLGFIVIADILEKRSWRRLSLHSKLMLVGTAALIGFAFPLFLALEWSNPATLGPLAWADKIQAAWFQAVTPRTAGFNTVSIGGLEESTSLVMMMLMAIGGGSTSTAGGIKVTTFIVLLLATLAFFKRRQTLHVFGRRLGPDEVMKVLALSVVAALLVLTALFLLTLTHEGDMTDLAFEVVSAFGTVGLSRGATGELDAFGKVLICIVMFAGRVGPLAFGFALATRRGTRVEYPSGQVYLG